MRCPKACPYEKKIFYHETHEVWYCEEREWKIDDCKIRLMLNRLEKYYKKTKHVCEMTLGWEKERSRGKRGKENKNGITM